VYMGFVLTWFRARRVRPGSSHVALTSLITSPAHSGRSGYPAGPARGAYPRRHGVRALRGYAQPRYLRSGLGGIAFWICTQCLLRESKSSRVRFASYDLSIYFQIPRESHPIRSRRVGRAASRDARRARGGGEMEGVTLSASRGADSRPPRPDRGPDRAPDRTRSRGPVLPCTGRGSVRGRVVWTNALDSRPARAP
jgi:hypothetical protein